MRVFGIDPGSIRTGYGCVDTDGRSHRLVVCGAIRAARSGAFPDRLAFIYRELSAILRDCKPECVAVENLFHAVNVRSALTLGHARGVAMLAAVEAGIPVVEYTPTQIKRAVVGYGRAEKSQVQRMIKLLLGLDRLPEPHDAADALAVAICHLHCRGRTPLNDGQKRPAAAARRPASHPEPRAAHPAADPRVKGPLSPAAARPAVPKTWRQYKPA